MATARCASLPRGALVDPSVPTRWPGSCRIAERKADLQVLGVGVGGDLRPDPVGRDAFLLQQGRSPVGRLA